jgi:hypothetical protein
VEKIRISYELINKKNNKGGSPKNIPVEEIEEETTRMGMINKIVPTGPKFTRGNTKRSQLKGSSIHLE